MANDLSTIFGGSPFTEEAREKTIGLKEGERRIVSILFADMHGFTQMSEKLDSEEVKDLTDLLMKELSKSVEYYGGYVDKYTGDQIMALFGAKVASEVDTQRAIHSALDMQGKVEKFNSYILTSKMYSGTEVDISLRIGINTGLVTTGKVGKERSGDFTVYGDVVNLASRMESNAPVGAIMVSQHTKELVASNFNFKDHGSVEVKGKSQPVHTFIVKSIRESSAKASAYRSAFIGREKEFQTLKDIYQNVSQNLRESAETPIQSIGIRGDAGIGKSRLISEYIHWQQANFGGEKSYVQTECTNISKQPYYLFISLIKRYLKISELDSREAITGKFNSGIEHLCGSLSLHESEALKDLTPFICFLLGVVSDDPRLSSGGQELQTNIQIALRTFITSAASTSNLAGLPFLVVIEDLQWIDPLSLDAFHYLLQTFNLDRQRLNLPHLAVVFLLDFRQNFQLPDQFTSFTQYEELQLNPFEEKDSIELIDSLLKKVKIGMDVRKGLLENSQGNPFFIEEWIQSIKDNQKLLQVDEINLMDVQIPENLNALILSRVDTLPADLKSLLQKATIVGEKFFIQILRMLEEKLGLSPEIQKPVDHLEELEFIQHYLSQADFYRFKHILTRDITYETILKSNRCLLHKVIGEIIEENYREELDSFLYDLAKHFDRAEQKEKAVNYLQLAVKKAELIYDNEIGIQFYDRLIELTPPKELETISNYLLQKGKIQVLTGKWDVAEKLFEDELKNVENLKNDRLTAEVRGELGNVQYLKGKYQDARVNFQSKLKIAETLEDKKNYYQGLGFLGSLNMDEGKLDEAQEMFDKQLEYYTDSNSLNRARVTGNIGVVFLRKGLINEALEKFELKLSVCKKLAARREYVKALGNIGIINWIQGEFEKSVKIFQEVLTVNEDIGDREAIAQSYGNIGLAYDGLKDYKNSGDFYQKQIDLCNEIGDQLGKAIAYNNYGIILNKMGQFSEAMEYYNMNLVIIEEMKHLPELANTYGNIAQTQIELGKYKKALENLGKSLGISEKLEDKRLRALINLDKSKILARQGKFVEAEPITDSANEYFQEINELPHIAECLLLKAEISRIKKEYEQSENSAEQALQLAKELSDGELKQRAELEIFITNLITDPSADEKEFLGRINKFDNKGLSKDIKANLYFACWQTAENFKPSKIKEQSIQLYEELYKKIPRFKYKQCLEKLRQ